MKKTLLRKTTIKEDRDTNMTLSNKHDNVKLTDLMIEMNDVLKVAASDLLQPRRESIKIILKKALG